MCGTKNDIDAKSCKYCGYLFEDFGSPGVSTITSDNSVLSRSNQPEQSSMKTKEFPPATSTMDEIQAPRSSQTPSSSSLNGTPLFVVSKSLLSSLAPSIGYLIFIALFASVSGSALYSIGLIVVLLLVMILPVLFSARKFEFYENSLRLHKIAGGDSEIPYSDLTLYDSPKGQRRPRIILSAAGQGRPIVIPGNPTNKELGQDLNQFLSQRVKKSSAQGANQDKNAEGSASVSESTDSEPDVSKDYQDGQSQNI
jgi:hypothetical protein